MLKLDAFFEVLDGVAPLSLSHRLIEKGDYDNSGIIVKSHEKVERVLFSLDLSKKAIERAKRLKCDTIVTHHPAIYKPISCLSFEGDTSALHSAIKQNLNVISMHLNLDIATNGIDSCFAESLGAKKYRILDALDEINGYGREFEIDNITFNEFIKRAKKNLKTSKVTVYGKRTSRLKKGASFCGGGASYAESFVLKRLTDADVIITSDMPHHVIKTLVEEGKNILIVPHYASENYGFIKYYENIKKTLKNKVEIEYFEDKRFL